MSPFKFRNVITKIRLRNNHLRVETDNKRYCELCGEYEVEDEYHFILVCNFYQELRQQCISKYYSKGPSMLNLLS